ncbi:4-aminobutyrate--2-oxoglutarate transaminase [Paucidesulfovibrio longus]|uniref:4-aminobutyrate--2-oxoglutarate transaminase n=1 Tax=Paucidesulfovibrio longus TaxID=889 RepID=UPI0003B6AD5A|nr:4-aminobutyrate--2-oxoglutarate transaminase [Paucidesulfovibrio longus]
MADNKSLLARREKAVPRGPFNTVPAFAAKAEGARITDVEGNEYIDFAGGIGVLNTGHRHPRVVEAIKRQADSFLHTCFHVFMYESYVELAERINALAPGDFAKKSFFLNSGAEAVENAVKIARYKTKRPAVVAFQNAFHGRTLLTMSLTSKSKPYKFGFGPFAPEIYRAPYAYCYRCPLGLEYPRCSVACADYLEEFFVSYVAAEEVAALLVEPVQGEGGFVTPPPEYFPKLRAICDKYGIQMIVDEIQTGFGRTGKIFAIDHWDVAPDMITVAKSLAGGMPLSGVVGRAELLDDPHVGGLGGTYGGNPLCCAAALAVLDALEQDGLLRRGEQLGKTLRSRFLEMQREFEIIGDVRGKGPMLALELVEDRESKRPATDKAKALVGYCREKGLIILACGNFGNVIRTLMPLVISDEELERGLSIMEDGLRAIKA